MALQSQKSPLGPFAVLVNNGFRYEYHMSVDAHSARQARAIFKRSGDWRADDFRVRDDRAATERAQKFLAQKAS